MKKKPIEVALPLDAISTASAREKSIRHGHPSTLHLRWAHRPPAAARSVIFAIPTTSFWRSSGSRLTIPIGYTLFAGPSNESLISGPRA